MEKLEDYIFYFENYVPVDLCNQLIEEYKEAEELEPAAIIDEVENKNGAYKDLRDCMVMNMSADDSLKKSMHRKDMDTKLFQCITKGYHNYKDNIPFTKKLSLDQHAQDTGYEFLKYTVNGKFVEHSDYFRNSQRVLSVSLLLNDEFKGGEFVFFANQKNQKIIKQKPGSLLFFPSNFLYPHQIMPIYQGIRYAVVSWFI